MNEAKKNRALVLFSGGLDSILAVKILEEQGIDAVALTYVSYFFDAEQAKKSAKENGIKLFVEDISKQHFEIVKNPRYGHGVGMNPCIDCHLLMLREAKKIMESGINSRTREYSNFLATGEVLGQRPMSQNIEALKLIEREAGLVGRILRPLSAKVLPETEMEKYPRAKLSGKLLGKTAKPLVDRSRLYGISGRSRKEQMKLAEDLGIKSYPSPAGGCILTDKEYSKKLRELLANVKNIEPGDIALLRIGRHFWSGKTRIILGRKHEENLRLKELAEKGDQLLELKNMPGPLALIRGEATEEAVEIAKENTMKYAKKADKMEKTFKTLKI